MGGVDNPAAGLNSYFADSFGGDYSATGKGDVTKGGFDIVYAYPEESFVNQWRAEPSKLSWTIVLHRGPGDEMEFAAYELVRAECA